MSDTAASPKIPYAILGHKLSQVFIANHKGVFDAEKEALERGDEYLAAKIIVRMQR